MLTAIRNSLSHWIVKVLFAVLIVAFAAWGIEDFLRGGRRDRTVATVAGESVSLAEAQEAFQRELADLRRSLGGRFEPTEEVRRAIAEATLGRLVALRAVAAEAAERGVAVTDEALRRAVIASPAFQGPDGRFSKPLFDSFLRHNGLTEARFLALLRADLARQQLVGGVRAGAAAPATLARLVHAFHAEERVADLVELPVMAAPAPAAPTAEELSRFHENNPDLFSAPEYRQVEIVLLTLDEVAAGISVGEAELRAAFEERQAEFARPERRRLAQAVVPERAAAVALAEAWRGGADLAAIAEQAKAAGGSAADLGLIDRTALPLPDLARAAFAAPQGGVTEPIATPFGFQVLRVEAIEPAHEPRFEEIREELARAVARERAADLIYARINRIEDSLAEGIPLAAVARRHDLRLIAVAAIDAAGRDPRGEPVELGLPAGAETEEVLAAIFEARPGETTRLAETRGGTFYALRVLSVIPPALRPLAEVEAEVRQAWERAERRRAMEREAAALLTAAQSGRPLAEAARAAGWTPRRTERFTRDGRGAGLPPPLAAALFALGRGEATMVEGQAGFIVAQVVEILPAVAEPAAIDRRRAEIARELADDLEAQFVQALRERAAVRIAPEAVRQIAGEAP